MMNFKFVRFPFKKSLIISIILLILLNCNFDSPQKPFALLKILDFMQQSAAQKATARIFYKDSPYLLAEGTAMTPVTPIVFTTVKSFTSFSVSPALPAGLSIDSATGTISGTPTIREFASSDYIVTASNDLGGISTTINMAGLYTISGTISGLTGTIILQNNTPDTLSVSTNGSFTFNKTSSVNSVTVNTYPTNQICIVTNSFGLAVTKGTNVTISCSTINYAIGGAALGVLKTGLTNCYDTSGNTVTCNTTYLGQDAQQSKSIPRSYSDNGFGVIIDNATGLVWQRCIQGRNIDSTCSYDYNISSGSSQSDLTGANNYCNSLGLAGRTWRLPTIQEFATITDISFRNPPSNPIVFPSSDNQNFWVPWTSTAYNSSNIWSVDSISGRISTINKNGKSYLGHCVSGQTSTLFPILTDNANYTITDNSTKLIWQKCSRGQTNDATCSGTATTSDWTTAISYCNTLSLAGIGAGSWRLPNRNELQSITDYTLGSSGMISLTFFPSTTNYFWTSSSSIYDPTFAWIVSFTPTSGGVNEQIKTSSMRVRCVTGGP